MQLQLPSNWKDYDALYVTAKGNDGKEIFTWSFPITKYNGHFIPPKLVRDANASDYTYFKTNASDSLLYAGAGKIEYVFSKKSGLLIKVSNDKQIIPFNNGPVLCEGDAQPDSVTVKKVDGIEAYDVIAWGGIALVVAKDGLYQYDYSSLSNISLISKMNVKN